MPNADTVNLAIQYATKLRRMNLAQRLVELARKKAEEEDEDNEADDELSNDEGSDEELQPSRKLHQKPISMKSSTSSFSIK